MADTKTSALTALTGMALTDKLYVSNSGTDKHIDFDDFSETGTFTPVIGDGTNNYTLSAASGFYARSGKLITVSVRVTWSSIGSASGILRLDGLPYNGANISNYRAGVSLSDVSGIDTSGGKQIIGRLTANTDYIQFYLINDNSSRSNVLSENSSSAGTLDLSISYQAA